MPDLAGDEVIEGADPCARIYVEIKYIAVKFHAEVVSHRGIQLRKYFIKMFIFFQQCICI